MLLTDKFPPLKAPSLLLLLFTLSSMLACEKEAADDGAESSSQPVGEHSELYLQDGVYKELQVSLFYMDGFRPKAEAVDSFQAFLEQYLRKPEGIEVVTEKIPAHGEESYSVAEIEEVLSERRTGSMAGTDRIFAYFLIVDGRFSGDDGGSSTLGIAYNANSMALFGETVHEYSDEATEPERWKLEATVLHHEFGHILGLVDNGTPMVNDHRDGGNGHHCDESDCLMYHTVETSDVVSMIIGSSVPDLDPECQKDLKQHGGK